MTTASDNNATPSGAQAGVGDERVQAAAVEWVNEVTDALELDRAHNGKMLAAFKAGARWAHASATTPAQVGLTEGEREALIFAAGTITHELIYTPERANCAATLRSLASEDGAAAVAAGAWVPWKPGDVLPRPQVRTLWLCTMRHVRYTGKLEPLWHSVRSEDMFDNDGHTEVIAYWSTPLPPPYAPPSPAPAATSHNQESVT